MEKVKEWAQKFDCVVVGDVGEEAGDVGELPHKSFLRSLEVKKRTFSLD